MWRVEAVVGAQLPSSTHGLLRTNEHVISLADTPARFGGFAHIRRPHLAERHAHLPYHIHPVMSVVAIAIRLIKMPCRTRREITGNGEDGNSIRLQYARAL